MCVLLYLSLLRTKNIKPIPISLPNGCHVFAKYSGTVIFNHKFYLIDVLYVPQLSFILVSTSKLSLNLNCNLIFSSNNCVIQDNQTKESIDIVSVKAGLYAFESSFFRNTATHTIAPSFNCTVKDINLWHYTMGHLSDERLNVLRTKYSYIPAEKPHVCDVCLRAKQKKLPFALSRSHNANMFELLHMDIWGPCSVISMHSFRYFLTIVDDFSRFTWVISLHTKSEVRNHIVNFIAYIENQFKTTVKIIRTDNGAEFAMKKFFSSKGIVHQTTCVETPEQNGIVERKHQHILNVTRALLFQANLPPLFWNFVVQHGIFLINCTPTPLLHNIAPYEKLNGRPNDLSSLRVFGHLCYSSTLTAHRKKLDDRSVHGIFLCLSSNTKGYTFLNLKNHSIEVSRNIIFYENHFPYHLNKDSCVNSNNLSLPIPHNYDSSCDITFQNDCHPHETMGIAQIDVDMDPNQNGETLDDTQIDDLNIPLRRSNRQRNALAYLADFQTDLTITNSVSTKYPINNFVSYKSLSPAFKCTILSISSHSEPHTYREASKHAC